MRAPPRRTNTRWTVEEDQQLLRLVKEHGVKNWTLISKSLPGRVGKQCRERWRNQLDPNIKTSPFTEAEDEEIISYVLENGTRWARIAEILDGRTENSIKNRFYSNLSKRIPKTKSGKSTKRKSVATKKHRPIQPVSDSSSDEYEPEEVIVPKPTSSRHHERSRNVTQKRVEPDFEYDYENLDEDEDEEYNEMVDDVGDVIPASPGFCHEAELMTESDVKNLELEAVECLLCFRTPNPLDVTQLCN